MAHTFVASGNDDGKEACSECGTLRWKDKQGNTRYRPQVDGKTMTLNFEPPCLSSETALTPDALDALGDAENALARLSKYMSCHTLYVTRWGNGVGPSEYRISVDGVSATNESLSRAGQTVAATRSFINAAGY